jgi:large subunit ribosomal protein L13
MGGLKLETARKLLEKKPEMLIHLAVKRMLPRNRMRPKLLKKLKIYAGPNHPHTAQNPQPIEI